MNSSMKYKGYAGIVAFSETDDVIFGKVHSIRSLISCEGTTVSELISDFHGEVNDCLIHCKD